MTLLAESFPTASLQSMHNNHPSPEYTLNHLAPFHVVVLIRRNYNLVKPSSSLKSASVPTQLNLAGEKPDCTECPPPPYPQRLPPAGPQCCAETTLRPTARFTGFPGHSSLFRSPHRRLLLPGPHSPLLGWLTAPRRPPQQSVENVHTPLPLYRPAFLHLRPRALFSLVTLPER